jgi:hypothetical protein
MKHNTARAAPPAGSETQRGNERKSDGFNYEEN